MWAAGVVLYKLVYGEFPFAENEKIFSTYETLDYDHLSNKRGMTEQEWNDMH